MRSGISATPAPDRASGTWPALGALIAAAVAGAIGLRLGATPVEQAVLAARYTARVSLALFLIVYLAGPAARVGEDMWRRWFAAFAVAHFIHLGTMAALFAVERRAPDWLILTGGGIGGGLVAAMLLGSARATLRRIGLDYLWLTLAATYFGRLFDHPDRRAEGVFALVLIVGAGLLRLVAARRRA